jgi:eukaryotic-like serine/threonine-protein kinase
MELLEGQTLKQRIASGRIPNDELILISLQVSNALEAAHSRGLVHRDIKPANIFLTSSGVTKILDFGLAKTVPLGRSKPTAPAPAVDDAITTQNTLTKSGVTLGTVSYLSPEQARGDDVDASYDLFAFGVVLYEMATRVLPFTGDTWAVVLNAILDRNPRPPRDLNSELMPELETVIEKALEKDKRTRYQTASDLQSDLLRAQRTLESSRVSAAEMQPRTRGRTWALGLTALIVLVVLGAAVAAKIFYPTNSAPTSPSEYLQITNFTNSAIWPSLSPRMGAW